MLLDTIGKGVEVHEMDADLIAEAVDYLEGHYSSLLMSWSIRIELRLLVLNFLKNCFVTLKGPIRGFRGDKVAFGQGELLSIINWYSKQIIS